MTLKLFNTFTREKELFEPVEAGKVRFYMCGPTVYDYIHIGNARAFIIFDVLRRYLRFLNYDVLYVMNLTDIDDKIINKAIAEGKDYREITKLFSASFFEDIAALGVERADIHPKATEHIDEIITLIQKLIDNGMAYDVAGDVFYNVKKFKAYGNLSGKKIEDLIAGSRVAVDEKKRNPLDFALWKAAKPNEPSWDSPWGKGRPGWHVECSAMSMKYLGESFDIHAGGTDLIFPHHENEVAQSEGASGKRFVKYWLHNGFLKIEGDKMAKSLGNFRTVKQILEKYSGVALRLFFLQKHYRSPIDFTYKGLQAATSASMRLKVFYEKLNKVIGSTTVSRQKFDEARFTESEKKTLEFLKKMKRELLEAMDDDLNTPVALSRLFDFVREVNKLLAKDELSENETHLLYAIEEDIEEINSFLGVFDTVVLVGDTDLTNELIALLIDVRKELRTKKEWALADMIRDRLGESGVQLEDAPDGTHWRLDRS
jgi:cysteinyl-tRNA synthetase